MSVETYKCTRCGAQMGIAGESTGSPDDMAADEYFDDEVRRHESGECTPDRPARAWKPGDLAVITWTNARGDTHTARALRVQNAAAARWVAETETFPADEWLTDARPLVVIDPEDREQVERLEYLMATNCGWGFLAEPAKTQRADALERALRSLIAPPKLSEPAGLGAVVECEDGTRFVRWNATCDAEIAPWTQADEGGADLKWADLDAVRILSEGWSA